MSEATFYLWKKKYAHLGVSELRRLRRAAIALVPGLSPDSLSVIDIISLCDIMSSMPPDPKLAPLKPPDAKELAHEVLVSGVVEISGHASKEMMNDELDLADCVNLLRAGVFEPPELIKGEWRYRVMSQSICVVFTFVSDTRLRVVTAWRIER